MRKVTIIVEDHTQEPSVEDIQVYRYTSEIKSKSDGISFFAEVLPSGLLWDTCQKVEKVNVLKDDCGQADFIEE